MSADPAQIANWISTIGFPITAYFLMFFKLDNSIKELTKTVQALCEKVVS